MTDHSIARSGKPSLSHRLQDVLYGLGQITLSAQLCSTNFRWLLLTKSVSLPLLDFDVICGTLPSVAIERTITDKEVLESIDQIIPDMYPGPYTIKHVINNLSQLYLPPGTIGDMLAWKEKKQRTLSSQAKRFLAKLNRAKESPDPALAICEATRGEEDIFGVLRDELASILTHFDDLANLDSVLDRSMRLDDYVWDSDKRDPYNNEAFRQAYKQLKESRPDYPRNNLHDALNVAIVVRMFNVPIQAEDGPLVPFYITQTQDILKLAISPNWFRFPRHQKRPSIFNSNTYFIMSRGLALRSGECLSNMIDEANILAEESASLAECVSSALATLSQIPDDEATIDCLSDHTKLMIMHKVESFNRNWGSLFIPVASAGSHDQTTYLNTLLSPEVKEFVLSDSSESVRKGIETLTKKLTDYKHPLYGLIEVVLEGNEQGSIGTGDAIMNILEFTWFDNDGSLLSEITPEVKRLEDFDDNAISDSYDLRFLVRLRNTNLPFLAVDARFDKNSSAPCYISIVWPNALDTRETWKMSLFILRRLTGNEDTDLVYNVFSDNYNHRGKGGAGSTIDVVDALAAEMGRINYFDIRSQEYTFFADTEPLNDIEKQAGVVFPLTSWCNRTKDILIHSMQQTRQIQLSKRYYDAIFFHIAEYVHFLRTDTERG